MKVLVTGGMGFIEADMLIEELLENNHTPIIFDHHMEDWKRIS